jgi:hypothetical protein
MRIKIRFMRDIPIQPTVFQKKLSQFFCDNPHITCSYRIDFDTITSRQYDRFLDKAVDAQGFQGHGYSVFPVSKTFPNLHGRRAMIQT